MVMCVWRQLVVVGALVCASAVVPAAAQQRQVSPERLQPPTSILIVDMERIKNESTAGRSVREQSDRIRAEVKAALLARDAAARKEEQRLAELRDDLEPEVFKERVRAFEQDVFANRAFAERRSRDVQALLVKAAQALKEAATRELAALMRERGASVMLDASQIILSVEALDITDEAIARLDRSQPTITVSLPPIPED